VTNYQMMTIDTTARPRTKEGANAMDGYTDFRMALVRDRLAAYRAEAQAERLASAASAASAPTMRAWLGAGLVRLGRAIASDATAAVPELGEPARFPAPAHADEGSRAGLRPAA